MQEAKLTLANMELEIDASIQGYNNKIIIATVEEALGLNNSVNLTPVPPVIKHTVADTHTTGGTGTHRKHAVDLPADKTLSNWHVVSHVTPHPNATTVPHTATSTTHSETGTLTHSEKKTTIVFGSMVHGIIIFTAYKVT